MPKPLEQFKPHEITLLISKASSGDNSAMDSLMPLIYPDLKRIASGIRHKQMMISKTLNTTSLVNEAWLRLNKYGIKAESRKHFFCIIAKAMRQILVNSAKEKLCIKRKANLHTLDVANIATDSDAQLMIQLNEIIESIEDSYSRLAEVFQFKYFLGFSEIEIADTLNINVRTVRRDWLTVKKIIQEIVG
jgi:RNA polymerase sigma factor (TIGR02999 family)